jgi:uncharacterized protein (DUF58 family)
LKLTSRGTTISFAVVSLVVASALFQDFLVGVALLLASVLIAFDFVWVGVGARKPEDYYRFERAEVASLAEGSLATLQPGEEFVERVRLVKAGGGAVLKPELRFLSVEPSSIPRGMRDSSLVFKFRSPYAGDYRVEAIDVQVVGPLGIASSRGKIPFKGRYSVLPRIVSVATSSINLFGKGGFGGTPLDFPGVGTEFYEMREYERGDDYRAVNWKASSRTSQLIVNEKMREAGVSYLLVLDATAPGFFDADRLASTFLALANSMAAAGVNFAVMVREGGKVTRATGMDDPRRSLAAALKAALNFVDLDAAGLEELVPVQLSSTVRMLAGGEAESTLAEISRIRATEIRSKVEKDEAWNSILERVREGETQSVVYVSGLFGTVEPLLELAWKARRLRNVDIMVADPCVPWALEADDRSAYAIYQRHQKAQRALRASHVECYSGDPAQISRHVLSRQPA